MIVVEVSHCDFQQFGGSKDNVFGGDNNIKCGNSGASVALMWWRSMGGGSMLCDYGGRGDHYGVAVISWL